MWNDDRPLQILGFQVPDKETLYRIRRKLFHRYKVQQVPHHLQIHVQAP